MADQPGHGLAETFRLIEGRDDDGDVVTARQCCRTVKKVFRPVNIGKGFQEMQGKIQGLRLFQGCGQHFPATPGDLRKKGGGRAVEADKIITAVHGRAEHQILVVQGSKGPGKEGWGESGTIGPDHHHLFGPLGKGLGKGPMQPGAQVALSLVQTGDVAGKPSLHGLLDPVGIADFQMHRRLGRKPGHVADNGLAHPPLERGRALGTQGRDQPGFGPARLGIAGKKNEPRLSVLVHFCLLSGVGATSLAARPLLRYTAANYPTPITSSPYQPSRDRQKKKQTPGPLFLPEKNLSEPG